MNDEYQDTRALALEFVGQFSRLQEMIEETVYVYLKKKTPNLARFIRQKTLRRISDEDRIDLLKLLSKELNVSHSRDLKTIFTEVKKARDSIAHSSRLESGAEGSLILSKNFFDTTENVESEPQKTVLTRNAILRMMHQCAWIDQHIMYMWYSSELAIEMYLGAQKISVCKPPERPEEWTGQKFEASFE